jgi:DNA-binding MarR family transcriptional regulator
MTGKPAYWKGLRLRGQWKKPPKTDLSVRKREVLLLFAQRDVWSIVELARADKCSVPTVSRAVDRLERQGLVWCVTAPEDRRRVLVRLTARGKELINTFG